MGLIHVAVGAIADDLGRILIAKRPDHVHQGGRWEFPGGKLESGETPVAALKRELGEELGIRVLAVRPLIRIHHDYGDRHVLLDVRRVTAFCGEPHGREGQPLDWVHPHEMAEDAFPAADRPIIAALRLPSLYLITGDDPNDADAFLQRLSAALIRGAGLVQLRAHALAARDFARLAERAFCLCEHHGALLLLNRDPDGVRGIPCHGIHLTGHLLALQERRPQGDWQWIGASCHSAQELAYAAALGLDYALLSPVMPTASHSDAQPLGWGLFAALADQAALPVFALGGLGPDDLSTAIDHGAQGIAAIRGLWSD